MTFHKAREPLTWADAIIRVIGAIGKGSAAAAVGRSENMVYKWGDPDADSLPSIEQAFLLDAAYVEAGKGEPPIFNTYAERLGRVGRPAHTAADPRDRLVTILSEAGDVADELRAALSPTSPGGTHITPNECARIAGEAQEAIDAIQMLIRDLEARSMPTIKAVG